MGELFALSAATCWAGSSIVFTITSRQLGSVTVNRSRLVLALLLVTLINGLRLGQLFPSMSLEAAAWLLLSGFIGFFLGDAMLFEAYVHIGASHGMLLMTLAPIFSAVIGWLFLSEILNIWQILAILLTLAGIAMVILFSPKKNGKRSLSAFGVTMGVGASLGQAVGLFFSKKGLLLGVPPFEANQMRLFAGAVSILVWGVLRRQLKEDRRKLMTKKVWHLIGAGTLLGPVFGVLFSLLAVQKTHMALAATLMGLTPVLMLPLMHYGFAERISLSALFGTVIAVSGAALLFWL